MPSRDYETTAGEVQRFFGRPLARHSHHLIHDGMRYVVFSFIAADDVARCLERLAGEPLDPRDKGGGAHWVRWYRGRAAQRDRNRSPYDFMRR